MIVDELLEKLNSSMFEEADFDEILDLRDEEAFDNEWVRVNDLVDQEKEKKGFSKEDEALVSKYREAAYKKVYELCEDSEIAAYLSDDMGLICESQLTNVTDPWLMELIKRYEAREIPCGKLL